MARRYAYWICTVLMALWLLPSGVLDLIRTPAVNQIFQHLGYPSYLGLILGTGKLLALAAIFDPRTRMLREWAYAGLTFDLLGAFLSHCAVHDSIVIRATTLLVLGLAAGSYLLRPDKYRLVPSAAPSPAGSLSVR